MRRYPTVLTALAVAGVLAGAAAASPAGAAPPAAAVAGPSPPLASPVAPVHARTLFVAPPSPWAAGHRGIDLLAAPGGTVASPAAGVVSYAGRVVDRGVVSIDHGGGVVSSLEPVAHAPPVGTRVARGEPVGEVGGEPGHCAPATCVHWGVRVDGAYVDPLDMLEGFGPVVLLPLGGTGAAWGLS
ncbi:M23 family metallopeptidase [Demequina sp. SYSU T00192]|uniref:M23 family metallopeptidase n=1 Tax=Demequina litoralis TaxID=3051660 RepID=A0ABT8G990_9MICO|nr:M23 family metallopeptidase [Demequina sp. SYSU T00192]MDN4475697.1 M23 family metallopeptidase [Demequina sp. SYSU T00192]